MTWSMCRNLLALLLHVQISDNYFLYFRGNQKRWGKRLISMIYGWKWSSILLGCERAQAISNSIAGYAEKMGIWPLWEKGHFYLMHLGRNIRNVLKQRKEGLHILSRSKSSSGPAPSSLVNKNSATINLADDQSPSSSSSSTSSSSFLQSISSKVQKPVFSAMHDGTKIEAEIRWILYCIKHNFSDNSMTNFLITMQTMFPDSTIAKQMTLSPSKIKTVTNYGLNHYFRDLLLEEVLCSHGLMKV